MKLNKILILSLMTFAVVSASDATARNVRVALPGVTDALKNASASDTIIISEGTWNDVTLKWTSPGFPVYVKADVPGTVVISGKSSLRLSGDSLTVDGLDFINAHPEKGHVIEFRNGHRKANATRLTNIFMDGCNPESRDQKSSYIMLYGRNNRVDHSTLQGKLNLGVTLCVSLNDSLSLKNNHRIDHNYFGPRPVFGSNGAETMRIGTSPESYEISATVVEDNLFEQCNGEVEIISVKSCGNKILNNTFYECQGLVALRHGRNNLVEGNFFAGNHVRNTGGVRVVDAGHIIRNNCFVDLSGRRFFSALAIMNAVPNSLPNRYVQVDNIDVSNNIFYDCTNIEFGTGNDAERTDPPTNVRFNDNTIYTDKTDPYTFIDESSDIRFKNNTIKKLSPAAKPKLDIEAVRAKVGAVRSAKKAANSEGRDTIELQSGIIEVKKPFVIDRPTVINGNGTTLRWVGDTSQSFIVLSDGADLKVNDVTFDGALQMGHTVARNGIVTSPGMITPYNLEVNDCRFINFVESSCMGIRGTKGTFANTFTVTGCTFSELAGNGINLADETDDKGVYNADDITIEGCTFSNMLGIPVNIYRGGSDESTGGPYVTIKNCTFNDCCNRERGSVLRLIGPQILTVADCNFNNSGRGGYSVRLDETVWEHVKISGCHMVNSGGVLSNHGAGTES